MNNLKINGTALNHPSIPILHIIKSLGRGGAEMLLPETLRKHDKSRYEFHYIYFIPWKFQMVEEIEREGGKVTCFSANNNVQILLQARKICKYVRENDIKLIHCHLPWAGIVGRLVGKITGVPVVYSEHNKWERYHKLTYFINKLSFMSQERVIAVSQDVANSIRKHHHKKKPIIQVVSNGINVDKYDSNFEIDRDIREELNIPQEATVIGTTCVFRKQKRLDIWLEIARAVHQRNANTHFIIVGDGVLRKEIHKKAKSLEMDKFLHFAGLQSETRPYLKAMNIFMMSSEFEGLPIALLEAMSMGCMPACTDAGGIPELVKDKFNGILVPVDEPMKMVNRLVEQLQQPDQMGLMGNAARKTVIDSFSMQKMVHELETIYSEILTDPVIGAIILAIVLYFVSVPILEAFKSKSPWLPLKLLKNLYWYHIVFFLVYYMMTRTSRSDSVQYYYMSLYYANWFDSYTTGTVFIHFLAYPFTNFLAFNYEMTMLLFSWFGYWGFVYFYIVFKENLRFTHKLYGYDLLTIFIFLPNMHYWTASLGKGAVIFLGIAMAIYGLSKLGTRKVALILGLIIVYHVRPHVFLFMGVGIVLGIFTGKQKIPFYQKFLVFAGSAGALILMYDSIISFVGLDQDNLLESFNQFSTVRAYELSRSAGSGLDTSNYPLIFKLITFWFRPLFIDSPNIIGIVVSFENVLYVFLTLKLFDRKFWSFLKSSPVLVKTSAVTFLATSFALSGTLSNLGIIIRQKSMVMYFLLFVVISFMDYKKVLQMEKKKNAMPSAPPVKQLQLT